MAGGGSFLFATKVHCCVWRYKDTDKILGTVYMRINVGSLVIWTCWRVSSTRTVVAGCLLIQTSALLWSWEEVNGQDFTLSLKLYSSHKSTQRKAAWILYFFIHPPIPPYESWVRYEILRSHTKQRCASLSCFPKKLISLSLSDDK